MEVATQVVPHNKVATRVVPRRTEGTQVVLRNSTVAHRHSCNHHMEVVHRVIVS